MTAPEQSDKRLELAYAACQQTLTMQDGTLGNLRTRANNLLAAAALFTSFSTGVGLINNDPTKGSVFPHAAALALIVIVALLGVSVLIVLWPAKNWVFTASAGGILAAADEKDANGKFLNDEDAIRREVINSLSGAIHANTETITFKSRAFQAAAILLLAEVLLLLGVLFER